MEEGRIVHSVCFMRGRDGGGKNSSQCLFYARERWRESEREGEGQVMMC